MRERRDLLLSVARFTVNNSKLSVIWNHAYLINLISHYLNVDITNIM